MKKKIFKIQDVTHSPRDWEDFWYSPEKYGTWTQNTENVKDIDTCESKESL